MNKNKPQKFAVFDIDGTIFRSSLLIELLRALIREGLFPKHVEHVYTEEFQRWLARRGQYNDYIDKVVQAYIENIAGISLPQVLKVSERLMIFYKQRVYRYTRDLVSELQKTHFLLAISHSPYHVVEPFCREWGFQKVYAQIYEIDDQERFTGKVEYEDLIANKGKILHRALEIENLTLEGSIGVGDTESDISMLEMVERPIAFNPNQKLYDVAQEKGWEIVVERKDVIYKL
jgi:HAD superfamily hydrolase (TIGR01490 family)